VEEQKKRLIELYASDQLPEDKYIAENVALDAALERLKAEKTKIEAKRPVDEYESVDPSIRRFSESARTRFDRCVDFDSKRQFLADHIEKVIFSRGKVSIMGFVPIENDPQQPTGANKSEFRIEGEIDRKAIAKRPKGPRARLNSSPAAFAQVGKASTVLAIPQPLTRTA
jgi:hypothetical protein